MRRLIVLLALCGSFAAVALPAGANNVPTNGTRIVLFAPPATFPANTPFYIEQGFSCQLADATCLSQQISAKGNFTLSLDDNLQGSTVDIDRANDGLRKLFLTDYPDGLAAGTHTFTGVFSIDGVVTNTLVVTITFN